MQHHTLIQGSPEWLAYRAEHFNASDAPAMMGCSPYKTRTQLLTELKTGLAAEVDAGTQRRFADGHRYEALARPLAEKLLHEELYPVTGSNGKLSASFDGLTMLEDSAFEHKSMNDDLRTAFAKIDAAVAGGISEEAAVREFLPLHYRVQMEHQALVSGCEGVLFMATKWDGEELLESNDCWYTPDLELRAQIVAGWDQLAADLESFVPVAAEVKPVGRTRESLPALRIEAKGSVVASNLDAFKTHALEVIGSINRELTTDQHFADAEKDVKWCGEVEDRIEAAKSAVLAQTETIDEALRMLDQISAEARAARLSLDKLVKNRKEQIRADIVAEATRAFAAHVSAINERLGGATLLPSHQVLGADFAAAVKGKRTVEGLRDGADTMLAKAKIAANEIGAKIERNLATFREIAAGRETLFSDLATILHKAADDFELLVRARITQHDQAEAERKQADEQRPTPATAASPAAPIAAPTPTVRSPAHRAANEGEKATLKLGEIQSLLGGLPVTADILASLGFEAVMERGAKLYRPSAFPAICDALIAQIVAARDSQLQAAA